MKTDALIQFPWPNLILIPLLLFFAIFLAIVIQASLKSSRQQHERLSLLPLEGEENE